MGKHFINTFIENLSKEEVLKIKKHIKRTLPKPYNSKSIEILEKIIRREHIEYGSSSSLNKLKSRILEKSLDALMIEGHFSQKTYSQVDSETIKLKKQIIQCRLLQRNLTAAKTEVFKHLLNDTIKEAKKNEQYAIIIEALVIKKYFFGIRYGITFFDKLNSEIKFYEYCYKSLENTIDNYMRLVINNDFIKNLSTIDFQNHLRDSIKQMESDIKITSSKNISYYLHIMKFAHAEAQKDYKQAIAICQDLVVYMKKYKFLFRQERMGFILSNMSLFNLRNFNYPEAVTLAKKSKIFFIRDSFHDLNSTELCFLSYFHSKRSSLAALCISKLLSHSTSNTGQFRKSKYIYYKACLHFAQGKYKEAQVLLREPLEIEKDKTRWNISLRILNIMIFIELNKKNEAIRATEALRKFLERTRKVDELKPRDLLISKLLKEMEKSNFVFDEENSVAVELLSQLSDKNSEVAWEHYTSELIPFHEWVQGKRVKLIIPAEKARA